MKNFKVPFVLGIDKEEEEKKKGKKKARKGRGKELDLPYFLTWWKPYQRGVKLHKQRSTNNDNQNCITNKKSKEIHLLEIDGHEFVLLACGESYNKRIRDNIFLRAKKIKAVINPCHTAGYGFNEGVKALKNWSDEVNICSPCHMKRGKFYRYLKEGEIKQLISITI